MVRGAQNILFCCIAKYGYLDAASRKAIHDERVATCVDVQKTRHAGQVEITGETAGFVVGWLTDQIPNLD